MQPKIKFQARREDKQNKYIEITKLVTVRPQKALNNLGD